jgi:Uma2 family endonuclease
LNIPAPKPAEKYVYADYLTWPDEERREIINGVAFLMSPAPSTEHQRILMELVLQFGQFLRNKPCQIFPAPFDVRLARREEDDEEIDSVVQPDIVVVCDQNKLDDRGCKGCS